MEAKDGLANVSQPDHLVDAGSDSNCGIGRTATTDDAEPDKVVSETAALIVATGVAVSIPLFVYLSFLHPDGATALIPAVLTTVLPYLAKRYMDRRAAK